MNQLVLGFGATILACLTPACVSGGCPWTHSSDVTIAPAEPCLAIQAPRSDGTTPGGCVDPGLVITNSCADALSIAAGVGIVEPSGQTTMTIAAGATGVFEIDFTGSARPVNDVWTVPAMLGTTPITLSFTTSN